MTFIKYLRNFACDRLTCFWPKAKSTGSTKSSFEMQWIEYLLQLLKNICLLKRVAVGFGILVSCPLSNPWCIWLSVSEPLTPSFSLASSHFRLYSKTLITALHQASCDVTVEHAYIVMLMLKDISYSHAFPKLMSHKQSSPPWPWHSGMVKRWRS